MSAFLAHRPLKKKIRTSRSFSLEASVWDRQ